MRPIKLLTTISPKAANFILNVNTLNSFLVINASKLPLYINILQLSIFSGFSFFHGLFFFESVAINKRVISRTNNLCYGFFSMTGLDFVSISSQHQGVRSCESLFFSLRWQEREASEFLNINFLGKTDKRALYLTPNFGLYPLQKDFPSIGFFEISLHSVFGLSYCRIFMK